MPSTKSFWLVAVGATALAFAPLGCVSDAPIKSRHTYKRLPYSKYVTPQRTIQKRREVLPTRPRPQATYEYAWHPSNGKISRRWTTVVVHHSATARGGAKKFDKFHRQQNGWDELGYHFVIGNGTDTPDGYVEAGPRWHKQKHGAHCKTPGNYYNKHGIGICLVGDFTKTKPTPRQLASLDRLVRFLTSQCGIPARRVTTHKAITGKTACPGPKFELATLRRSLLGTATASSMPW